MYGEQSYVEVLCGGVLGYCRTTAAGWPHSLLALAWHLVECGADAVVGQGWERQHRSSGEKSSGNWSCDFRHPTAVQTKMNRQSAMRSSSTVGNGVVSYGRTVLNFTDLCVNLWVTADSERAGYIRRSSKADHRVKSALAA
jgi:hypothetical protein